MFGRVFRSRGRRERRSAECLTRRTSEGALEECVERGQRSEAPAEGRAGPGTGSHALRQARRFVVVGVLAALLDYGSYRLLLLVDVPIDPAKAVGFILGTTLSYLLNRLWTFGAGGRAHVVGRFLALYATTLVINVAVNAVLVRLLDGVTGRITIAWLIAQGVASALNFLGMRYLVFPARPAAEGSPHD
jgi:putative flippase GtrA